MAGPSTFKLSFLAHRRHLPALPGQAEDADYGFIWDACPIPVDGSCYIVKFGGGSQVSIIAYVDDRGCAYLVDGPIRRAPEGPPDLAIVPDEDGREGTVYARRPGEGMQARGRYTGSLEGTMRELGDAGERGRSLAYRPFMASAFLRHCVIGAAGRGEAAPAIDLDPLPVDHEVDVFEGFGGVPLPDAIDAFLFRAGEQPRPAGLECYAGRTFRELDLPHLRDVARRTPLSLAYIERMESFYVNFDRANLDGGDVRCVLSAESALNRVLKIMQVLGGGPAPVLSSPTEEACSVLDRRALRATTGLVGPVLDQLGSVNPLGKPGSVTCVPGGEWDVRTRFATICESLGVIVRLWYDMRFNASTGEMLVRFAMPGPGDLPRSRFSVERGAWEEASAEERSAEAFELGCRIAVVLAAAGFASGIGVRRVLVERHQPWRGDPPLLAFDRDAFLACLRRLAADADGAPLAGGMVADALALFEVSGPAPQVNPVETMLQPVLDTRPLPSALRDLLMADDASELEVMEAPGDGALARIPELAEVATKDPARALGELADMVDALEARCAATELAADRPVSTQFCDSYLGRVLLPIVAADRGARFLRAPDALFYARHEICAILAKAGTFASALPEARRLVDMAATSMQAHFMLVNILARLERFDEVAEACRHALRVAPDDSAASYLYYRLAFALWRLGDRETALACYRMVLPTDDMGEAALREARDLMASMGVAKPPARDEAIARLRRAGVPVAPTPEVSTQVADAAVLLADNGFFFLAGRLAMHMWRATRREELAVVGHTFELQW